MKDKQIAAEAAASLVSDGMTIGIGTGSTVYYFIIKLAEMVRNGLNILTVSTSLQSTKIAVENGIRIAELSEVERIDLTVDGADEVDPHLNGIKGGGGALLREKIIASFSDKVVWVVDHTKLVSTLGKFPLPVEVVPFAHTHILKKLNSLGFNAGLRVYNGAPYVTDNSNYILDISSNIIQNPFELEKELNLIPGVVENGLFLGVADMVIAGKDGTIQKLTKKQ